MLIVRTDGEECANGQQQNARCSAESKQKVGYPFLTLSNASDKAAPPMKIEYEEVK
jgi:hypothetical protein